MVFPERREVDFVGQPSAGTQDDEARSEAFGRFVSDLKPSLTRYILMIRRDVLP